MPEDKPVRPTPTQLLRRLMTCFYEHNGEIYWAMKENKSVRDVLGREFENELREYMP